MPVGVGPVLSAAGERLPVIWMCRLGRFSGKRWARWAGTTVTANVIAWASGVEGLRVALEGKCFRCEALLPLFLRRLRRSKEDAQPTAGLVIQPTSLLRE